MSTVEYVLEYQTDLMPADKWVQGGNPVPELAKALKDVRLARSPRAQKTFKAQWRVMLVVTTRLVMDL